MSLMALDVHQASVVQVLSVSDSDLSRPGGLP
jgi:hypothetical protein